MHSIIPRIAFVSVVSLSFAACTTLDVKTDLDELPSRDDSVSWLNNYFIEKDKQLIVSKEMLQAPRKAAPPYRCIVEYTTAGFMNVACSGTRSGRIGSGGQASGSFKELVRWSTTSQAEAIAVIENLMVLGVRYNKVDRLIPQECFRSNKGCPPGYP